MSLDQDQDQIQASMSLALTEYARKQRPFPFKIEVTKETKGGDLALNGKRVVRLHPSVIMGGTPIPEIIERIFILIDEPRRATQRLRDRYIAEAKEQSRSNLGYLSRHLSPDEFQIFIERTIGL